MKPVEDIIRPLVRHADTGIANANHYIVLVMLCLDRSKSLFRELDGV